MAYKGTVGRLLVEQALPAAMRGRPWTLDKKGLSELLREVGTNHPDDYRRASHALLQIGKQVGQESGGASFDVAHLTKSQATLKREAELRRRIEQLADDESISDDDLPDRVLGELSARQLKDADEVYNEALAADNPIAQMAASGSRGNRMNLSSLLGSDKIYTDFRDNPIPFPVLRSYSQGLSPTEYFASTYGARKGVVATKKSVAEGGYFGKRLVQASHRLVVIDKDGDGLPDTPRGLPVSIDDPDNEGALLAVDAGPYKRNTVLTPKILKELKARGLGRLLVRSPMVGGPPGGGVYANDVGVREYGTLPSRGDFVGIAAAQALGEPVAQGALSTKHAGGVAGQSKSLSGFKYLDFLIEHPRTYEGVATHAQVDGRVEHIKPGPAGGWHVRVGGKDHYVPQHLPLKVKRGDEIEAGDILSEGAASPAQIAEHKGIGEGRRFFTQAFRNGMKESGMQAHRRNVELVARGLFDHVEMTDEYDGDLPDDVVPYSALEARWKPREGFYQSSPGGALGKYIEKPILHYTIGTKIRPSVVKELESFGIKNVDVHDRPPPFRPVAVRAMYNLQHDPDWMVRQYGSGLKEGLLEAAHRGRVSDREGTSFVPSLAHGVDFGKEGPFAKGQQTGGLMKLSFGAEPSAPGAASPSGGAPTMRPVSQTASPAFGGGGLINAPRERAPKYTAPALTPSPAFGGGGLVNAPRPKPPVQAPVNHQMMMADVYAATPPSWRNTMAAPAPMASLQNSPHIPEPAAPPPPPPPPPPAPPAAPARSLTTKAPTPSVSVDASAGFAPGFGPSGSESVFSGAASMRPPNAVHESGTDPRMPMAADPSDPRRSVLGQAGQAAGLGLTASLVRQTPGQAWQAGRSIGNGASRLLGGGRAARFAGGALGRGLGAASVAGSSAVMVPLSLGASLLDETGLAPEWLSNNTADPNNPHLSKQDRYRRELDPTRYNPNAADGGPTGQIVGDYLGGVGNAMAPTRMLRNMATIAPESLGAISDNAKANARATSLDAQAAPRTEKLRAQDADVSRAEAASAQTGEGFNPNLIRSRQKAVDAQEQARKGYGERAMEWIGGLFG